LGTLAGFFGKLLTDLKTTWEARPENRGNSFCWDEPQVPVGKRSQCFNHRDKMNPVYGPGRHTMITDCQIDQAYTDLRETCGGVREVALGPQEAGMTAHAIRPA
jgi:hypothetical protein